MLKIPAKLNKQLASALEYYEVDQKITPLSIQKEMNQIANFWFHFDTFIKKNQIQFQNQAEEKALSKLFQKYWDNVPREYLFGFSEKIKNHTDSYASDILYKLKDCFNIRWGGLAQPVFNQLKAYLVKFSLENLSLFFIHQNILRFKMDFQQKLNQFLLSWLYAKQEDLFHLSPWDYFFLENKAMDQALPLDLINWQAGEVNILMELEGKEVLRQRKIMKRMQKKMRHFFTQIEHSAQTNFSSESLGREFEDRQQNKIVETYSIPVKEKFPIVQLAEKYGNQALKITNPFFMDKMVDRDIARFSQSAFVPTVKISVALSMLWLEKKTNILDNISQKIAFDNLILALDYLDVSFSALEGISKKILFPPQLTGELIETAQEINQELKKILNDLRLNN